MKAPVIERTANSHADNDISRQVWPSSLSDRFQSTGVTGTDLIPQHYTCASLLSGTESIRGQGGATLACRHHSRLEQEQDRR